MSFTRWFRRLFLPGRDGDASKPPDVMIGAPGVSGFAAIEDAAAVDAVVEETDPPTDPAS